jgi:hypothetical protein
VVVFWPREEGGALRGKMTSGRMLQVHVPRLEWQTGTHCHWAQICYPNLLEISRKEVMWLIMKDRTV